MTLTFFHLYIWVCDADFSFFSYSSIGCLGEIDHSVEGVNDLETVAWDFTEGVTESLLLREVEDSSDKESEPRGSSVESGPEVLDSQLEVLWHDNCNDLLGESQKQEGEIGDLVHHWDVTVHGAREFAGLLGSEVARSLFLDCHCISLIFN